MTTTAKSLILKIISVFFIFGGAVRLVANRATFQSFFIGHLWFSRPYAIYIYRVLGAFVVFAGVSLFIAAQKPKQYALLLKIWSFGFTFVGIVMLLAGMLVRLSLAYYAPDFIFCFFTAIVLYVTARQ